MLNSIKMKNFESYEDGEITFVEGVNVISGLTDSGKSSALRLIDWIRLNRPVGNEFFRNGVKKGNVEGILDFDGIEVKRVKSIKSGGKNEYWLGDESFEVVNQSVPKGVTDFLNIDEITVQGQHDPYFLLQNTSPGEVAKKLNKVAGFEIIDALSKSVKTAISINTSDVSYVKETISELEEKIEKYEHLDSVEKQLKTLQKLKLEYEKKSELILKIQNSLEKIQEITELIESLDSWLTIEDSIKPIIDSSNILIEKQKELEQLTKLLDNIKQSENTIKILSDKLQYEKDVNLIINSINSLIEKQKELGQLTQLLSDTKQLENTIQSLSDRLQYEKDVKDILSLINKYNERVEALNSLTLVLDNIRKTKIKINQNNEWIERNTIRLNEILIAEKICPLCGEKLTDKGIEHIKHGL